MVLPNLIHPVDVTLRLIDRAGTELDVDAREPIRQAARLTDVIVPGQPNKSIVITRTSRRREGRVEEEEGYVLFRRADLEARSVRLPFQAEDKIAKIGNVDVDLYVDRVEPVGHYQDQGGSTLLKVFGTDRKPAKKAGA